MTAVRRTPLMELMWRTHRFLFRASGGRIGAQLGALPVLSLSVRGRKSGAAREVLLNYLRDGDRLVVFASHAGEEREPPWWLNLRDAGEAEVMIAGERFRVRAREAQGAERERLWSRVKESITRMPNTSSGPRDALRWSFLSRSHKRRARGHRTALCPRARLIALYTTPTSAFARMTLR